MSHEAAEPDRILETVRHRPWPLPRTPWVMFQRWSDLLFAHWSVAPEQLRSRIPAPLELDLHDGRAWIAVTPFVVEGFRARGLPTLPAISSFPELNLRTYVRVGGKPGIHFFSLDAGSAVAAAGARLVFRLPYHDARMSVERETERVGFRSERPGGAARFHAEYGPTGPVAEAEPGTLEHFLAERYAFFTVLRSGRVLETHVHHSPWPLQAARAEILENRLPAAEGLTLPDEPPLLHFSRRQDSLIWPPMALDRTAHPG